MKNKLGTILSAIGGGCICVGFITFALGGFISVNESNTSGAVVVGFLLFFIGMILLAVGSYIRGHHTKNISDGINTVFKNNIMPTANLQTKCGYCGSVYDKNLNSCPNCGAKQK